MSHNVKLPLLTEMKVLNIWLEEYYADIQTLPSVK